MLALVGSGEYLPAMQPVDGVLLQRLRSTPRVACLPTAAGAEGAERIAYWSRLGVEHFTRLGAQAEALPIIDRASAHDARLAATLADCSFVYFSGGRSHQVKNYPRSATARRRPGCPARSALL